MENIKNFVHAAILSAFIINPALADQTEQIALNIDDVHNCNQILAPQTNSQFQTSLLEGGNINLNYCDGDNLTIEKKTKIILDALRPYENHIDEIGFNGKLEPYIIINSNRIDIKFTPVKENN